MNIKVNDNVLILAGKDKGKTGKVLKTLKNENKVVVEGINISKRHTKPKTNNDKGGIFDIEMPIHISNVKKVEEKAAKKEAKKETKTTAKKTTKKASK
jgi:large subunit ribosomal protein L24